MPTDTKPAPHPVLHPDLDLTDPAVDALFEAIWIGDTRGFSEKMLRDNLREMLDLRVRFDAKTIRPSKIIGSGLKRQFVRPLADEYLTNQTARIKWDLASRGRTNPVNRANVAYRLRAAGV